jgi:Domain of unknown function (DUF4112)
MTDPAARPMPGLVVNSVESRKLKRLRALARVLDNAVQIPGTEYRVGLDALIGLVPGIGDAISAIFSTFIIFQAARLGAPRSMLMRMLANVGIDTLVGEVPIVGDLFDVAWKSNLKNVDLLEAHLQQPAAVRQQSRRLILALSAGLLLLLVLAIVLGIVVGNLVLHLLK